MSDASTEDVPDRIRVVYREVDHDVVDGSMSFVPEKTIDVRVETITDSVVEGVTPDGRDIVVRRGHHKEVRTRPAGETGTFRRLLGYRQRFERVEHHHTVCRDCTFEELRQSAFVARALADGHEAATGHTVAYGRVE
jgi:hypothetical protein